MARHLTSTTPLGKETSIDVTQARHYLMFAAREMKHGTIPAAAERIVGSRGDQLMERWPGVDRGSAIIGLAVGLICAGDTHALAELDNIHQEWRVRED